MVDCWSIITFRLLLLLDFYYIRNVNNISRPYMFPTIDLSKLLEYLSFDDAISGVLQVTPSHQYITYNSRSCYTNTSFLLPMSSLLPDDFTYAPSSTIISRRLIFVQLLQILHHITHFRFHFLPFHLLHLHFFCYPIPCTGKEICHFIHIRHAFLEDI